MNILYIGRFYPKGILETIVSDTNGKVGFSNHNFEMSIIKGLSSQEAVNLRVLSAPMVYSYPHNNKKAIIKPIEYNEDGVHYRSIGFCNIAGINLFTIKRSLTKAIIQELNSFAEAEVNVIVNTPSLILSSALFDAAKYSQKRITTTLIVPDVPECMVEMSGSKSLKTRLVEILNKRTAALSMKYDKYVYLTEAMNDFYHAANDKYMVMEGLLDENRAAQIYQPLKSPINKEIILYTGTLRRIFGIMRLIEVFEQGQFENAELWICGSGECATEIKQCASRNKQIIFYGLVDSKTALNLQSKATILANPRTAEGRYTKYSFPSKTIEYLLAGRNVIMNRLPGIPKEYDDYLYYPTDDSTDAWITKLREVMDMNPTDRINMCEAARRFILSKKSANNQCRRIIDFLKNQ